MEWTISNFTVVTFHNGQVVIESLTSGTIISTPDIGLLQLTNAFAQPRTIENVMRDFNDSDEKVRTDIQRLIKAQVLIPVAKGMVEANHPWDWRALAYHRESRRPGFQKTAVKTASISPEREQTNWISLQSGFAKKGREFTDVLEARRSERTWSNRSISMETFSGFLWISAKNRGSLKRNVPNNAISRLYPSGGGIYSLELFAVIAKNAVEGLAAGLYKYLPDFHMLHPITENYADFQPFFEAAGNSGGSENPPVVLLITSRFADQSAAYGNLAYSLVLKEVGGLFQTFYLAAEYFDLHCCALGGGASNTLLARLCNTNDQDNPLIGEFMLGPS